MDYARDLARIALQEERLQFERFDADVAWEIGTYLRNAAAKQGKAIAIDITLAGMPLFFHSMSGTSPSNADWIRRKKNTVGRVHKSSYSIGLGYQQSNGTLHERTGLPLADYVAAGGCFPIRLKGSAALLGTITVSGLPERDDHELVVAALAHHLGIDVETVALGPA
jgi:uncharacterized protein (UPF0303 family)